MFFDLLIDEGLDLLRALIYRYAGRDEPKRKGRQGLARRLVRPRRVVEVTEVEASEEQALIEAPRRRGSALPWILIGAVGVAAGIIIWQRMNANAEAPLVE